MLRRAVQCYLDCLMYPRDLAMRDALDYEFLYNKRGGFFETVITALYRGVVREGDAVLAASLPSDRAAGARRGSLG
jgi:hypothetical protein